MEDTVLIDASQFAETFNSFWNENAPTCEHFLRRLNSGGLRRFEPPMEKSDTTNRAVIAELAFSIFVEGQNKGALQKPRPSKFDIENIAWQETTRRLSKFETRGMILERPRSSVEKQEVEEISKSLFKFFTRNNQNLITRPLFKGCGYVDASEGDVIVGDTIYEVKTVERPFRSSDLRQVLSYAALNSASNQFQIKKLGLFNPRSGKFCELSLDVVCEEICGRRSQEFLALIVETISSGEISR